MAIRPAAGSGVPDRLALPWTVFILVLTLGPFEAHRVPDLALRGFAPLDFLLNLLLFLPLGLASHRDVARTAALGLGLSLSLEAAQVWLYRGPSLFDVAANALGAGLGAWDPVRARLLARCPARIPTPLLLAAFLLLFAAALASRATIAASDFRNWEEFPLVLGNEAAIERPWSGRLHEILVYDRALDGAGSEGRGGDERRHEAGGPVLRLDAGSPQPLGYVQEGPDRIAFPAHPPPESGARHEEGAFVLRGARWVLPDEVAHSLRRLLVARGELTVVAILTPDGLQPGGQGRILSHGLDFTRRNFGLGQKGADLHWRVRTPATGENGDRPQIITRRGVLADRRTVVVAAFSTHRSRLWVDGRIEGDLLLSESRPKGLRLGEHHYALLGKDLAATTALLALLLGSLALRATGRRSLAVAAGFVFVLVLEGTGTFDHYASARGPWAAAAALLLTGLARGPRSLRGRR